MSQHSDLLTLTLTKGISRGHSASAIVNDTIELLDTLEYDDSFTDLFKATEHIYSHAKGMLAQKDGLYGISHSQLDKFLTELWSANQWLKP